MAESRDFGGPDRPDPLGQRALPSGDATFPEVDLDRRRALRREPVDGSERHRRSTSLLRRLGHRDDGVGQCQMPDRHRLRPALNRHGTVVMAVRRFGSFARRREERRGAVVRRERRWHAVVFGVQELSVLWTGDVPHQDGVGDTRELS